MQNGEQGVLDRVEIDIDDQQNLTVRPIWKDVDRTCTQGYCLRPSHRALAERLKRCMEAGAAFVQAAVATDTEGRTYVAAVPGFFMKAGLLDKRLKELGF